MLKKLIIMALFAMVWAVGPAHAAQPTVNHDTLTNCSNCHADVALALDQASPDAFRRTVSLSNDISVNLLIASTDIVPAYYIALDTKSNTVVRGGHNFGAKPF